MRTFLRMFVRIIFVLGIGMGVFGWWGLFTKAGKAEYEGLAAIGPFYIGAGGIALFLITSIIMIVARYREGRTGFDIAGHCAKCGYNLKGTTSPTCPECGEMKDGSSQNI